MTETHFQDIQCWLAGRCLCYCLMELRTYTVLKYLVTQYLRVPKYLLGINN